MRNRFDRQLEELNEMLIHMGELCETAIEEATGALEGHDIARAKAVITADSEIDQMEKEIENLCLKLLLQQQPVARDLRRISASLKMPFAIDFVTRAASCCFSSKALMISCALCLSLSSGYLKIFVAPLV